MVYGQGGGGKGGSGATESPNNLQSKNIARIVDLLSEGEIRGFVDGFKSVFLDETPIQNADGSYNFKGIQAILQPGLPDQSYIAGFSESESEISVNTEIKNSSAVVRTITDATFDLLRVTISTPQLTKQNNKTGDITGTFFEIAIDLKSNGGSFIEVKRDLVSGKTTSKYQRSYVIELTGNPPWEVRVRRITADNSSAFLQNKTFWDSYTGIVTSKVSYDDSAYVAALIDAEQFGQNIPARAYEIYGIKIKVPTNYNTETRVYTGIWDGTFKTEWSNNPAWVLYDLLTNKRYGLGQSIDPSKVDKWAFYKIARYCDELVPDGKGGFEPRFLFDYVINTREDAYKVIRDIAGSFNGLLYWGSGVVVPIQDSPATPKKLVTPANVIDGQFTYSGTGLKTRHSVVNVTYNNPDDGYKPAVVSIEDPELIEKFGYYSTDVVAYGCTRESQAIRTGKWIIDTERYSTEVVTYKASLDHADVRPGDVVEIADPNYQGVRFGGRIKGVTPTTITFDAPIDLVPFSTYYVSVMLPDGNIATRQFFGSTTPLTVDTVNLVTPFTDLPDVGSIWTIGATEANPRRFRIISLTEPEKNIFEITGVFDDPTKYARVEQGIQLPQPDYSAIPTGAITPPSQFSHIEFLYQNGAIIEAGFQVSWTAPNDSRVRYYELFAKRPGEENFEFIAFTGDVTYKFQNAPSGRWQIRVNSMSINGVRSANAFYNIDFIGLLAPPAKVENFRISLFNDLAYLYWDAVPDIDISHYVIKFTSITDLSEIEWDNCGVLVEKVAGNLTTISVPNLNGTYLIKAVDLSGIQSQEPSLIISNNSATDINVIEVLREDPGFAGVKDGVAVDGDTLKLGSSSTLAGMVPLAKAVPLNYVSAFSGIGYYYFDNNLDLGDVYTSRIVFDLVAYGYSSMATLSTFTPLAIAVPLSGIARDQWDAYVEYRTTDVNPSLGTWTDWKRLAIGDYTARAFEFRLVLKSAKSTITPIVEKLSVTIDMPDRVSSGENITCPSSGMTVYFDPPFLERPAVAVTGQNLNLGDRQIVSGVTKEKFEIEFRDGSNSSISKTFDYIAKGYGYKQ